MFQYIISVNCLLCAVSHFACKRSGATRTHSGRIPAWNRRRKALAPSLQLKHSDRDELSSKLWTESSNLNSVGGWPRAGMLTESNVAQKAIMIYGVRLEEEYAEVSEETDNTERVVNHGVGQPQPQAAAAAAVGFKLE
eukprot:208666-Rhodomonas_salina.1